MTNLYNEYRPQELDEFYGNKSTVKALAAILEREKDIPHVFLFQGPSGCGKTTLARIVADKLGCDKSDFQELNSSNNRGIETSREIIISMNYRSLTGGNKVYLLDESHAMTVPAQNALLKAFEDTPDHVYFLLCTTDPNKLIPALRNRCSIFQVNLLPQNRMVKLLKDIAEAEEVKIADNVIKKLAESSNGSPRQALVLLDQIKDMDQDEMENAITEIETREKQIIELCRALLDKKWPIISKILKELDEEPEKVRWAVLGYMNAVLLNNGKPKAATVIECFSEPFYNTGKAGLTLACYDSINE